MSHFFKDSASGPDNPCRREDSSRIFFHESAYWIRTSSIAVEVRASPIIMYTVQSSIYVVSSVEEN